LDNPRGWGISKAESFKGKYEAKQEFPEGYRGFKPKTLPFGEGVDSFSNNTMKYLETNT